MKNNIFSHPGLKISSLVIAFVIWLAIMNIRNPVSTKTYSNVSVNITNASYVETKEQLYAVVDGTAAVGVTVTTNRKLLERLSSSMITATADLTQITDFTDPVYVPVTVNVPGVSADDVTVNPRMIEVKLEDIESTEFLINPTTAGTTPAKGTEVGKMTVKPDTIRIRGPKSVVDKIDKVNASVDVSRLKEDSSLTAEIEIYDRNGDPLDELEMSYLTIGDESTVVKVSVELYSIVSDVTIEAETYGKPEDGYRIGEITTTPAKLSIVGSDEALESFKAEGNRILIPESSHDVDISGASSDQDFIIDITIYLPEGISLVSDTSSSVVVSVEILPEDSRSIEIETKNIKKKNLAPDYTAVFSDSKISVRIKSDGGDLSALNAEDISASADLTGILHGEHAVPLEIELPEGYELVENVTADMTVSAVLRTKEAQKESDVLPDTEDEE